MSVSEYRDKFIQLSRYAPDEVVDDERKHENFMEGLVEPLQYQLVMRKKGKVTEDLEFYSVMRSIRAIEESDVCILMLDAQQGLESQDLVSWWWICRT